MVQAIGRLRRQGQKKTVKVYHILAQNTVEMDIMAYRRNEYPVLRDGKAMFIPKEDFKSDSDKSLLHGDDGEGEHVERNIASDLAADK